MLSTVGQWIEKIKEVQGFFHKTPTHISYHFLIFDTIVIYLVSSNRSYCLCQIILSLLGWNCLDVNHFVYGLLLVDAAPVRDRSVNQCILERLSISLVYRIELLWKVGGLIPSLVSEVLIVIQEEQGRLCYQQPNKRWLCLL